MADHPNKLSFDQLVNYSFNLMGNDEKLAMDELFSANDELNEQVDRFLDYCINKGIHSKKELYSYLNQQQTELRTYLLENVEGYPEAILQKPLAFEVEEEMPNSTPDSYYAGTTKEPVLEFEDESGFIFLKRYFKYIAAAAAILFIGISIGLWVSPKNGSYMYTAGDRDSTQMDTTNKQIRVGGGPKDSQTGKQAPLEKDTIKR